MIVYLINVKDVNSIFIAAVNIKIFLSFTLTNTHFLIESKDRVLMFLCLYIIYL